MKLELNRRTFLIVLGVATAASGIRRSSGAPKFVPATTPYCYFTDSCAMPPAMPRTAAITYLPLALS